jgi:hypothetical protein
MTTKDKDEKDGGSEETDKESSRDKDDSDGDEGELTAVKSKSGEPADNLRRRADWFQKRHGGG